MNAVTEHLQELIDEADPDGHYMQPASEWVAAAQEDFEAEGFKVREVPWGAIAMRADELQQES
ncbi:MAG: hypothetical protein AABM42_11365 [Actinomycetota bacterium]